jgi:hypothetical protein
MDMGMSRGLVRQIEAMLAELRAIAPEPPPEADAEDAAHAERRTRLSATMAPEHVAIVNAVWEAHERGDRGESGHERLARVVHELLEAAERFDNFRLALPPPVAQMYLAEPTAHVFAQCKSCGLTLPIGLEPWRGAGRSADREWFATCPDCGGETGLWDQWRGGATLPRPCEKR